MGNSQRGNAYDEGEAQEFDQELERIEADLDGAGIEHDVRRLVQGREAAEDLIAVADEVTADFIVIGLRRRTPVGKLILGSNAQKILLDSSCPVLAVKVDHRSTTSGREVAAGTA